MDWRPYTPVFVSNTFKEFVSRHDFKPPSERDAINGGPKPLFSFKPSARDIEIETEKLTNLRRHVLQQRRLIRIRDEQNEERKKKRGENDIEKINVVKAARRRYEQQVRMLVNNKGGRKGLRSGTNTPEKRKGKGGDGQDDSSLFALTCPPVSTIIATLLPSKYAPTHHNSHSQDAPLPLLYPHFRSSSVEN